MILADWQLTVTNMATSGAPGSLNYSESAAEDISDLLVYRPNVSGYPINPKSARVKTATALGGYLNPYVVNVPIDAADALENAGRNSLRDMTFNSLNLGLHKSFRLWNNSSSFELRGEAFYRFEPRELLQSGLQAEGQYVRRYHDCLPSPSAAGRWEADLLTVSLSHGAVQGDCPVR